MCLFPNPTTIGIVVSKLPAHLEKVMRKHDPYIYEVGLNAQLFRATSL